MANFVRLSARLWALPALAAIGCTDGAVGDATSSVDTDAAVVVDSGGVVVAADDGVDSAKMEQPDTATPDTAPPDTVPVFVAQGYMGRTIVSCDRGETWVGNRSDDDALRCFAAGADCDHNGGRAMGITFGADWFVATWGWGKGNSIRRSRDGFAWERVVEDTTFSGVEFAGGRFVAFAGSPRVSTDAKTWMTSPSIGFKGHIRSAGHSDFGGGRFIAAGSENGSSSGEVMTSADGVTWKRPTEMPAECGLDVGWNSIASGAGVTVIVSDKGTVCRSTDGGDRWTKHALGGTSGGSVVHDGTRFLAFGRDTTGVAAFESNDGSTWTARRMTLTKPDGTVGTPSIGAVAHGGGRFVAVNGGWDRWYEKQTFSRSDDGVAWTELPRTAFVGSHPIAVISFGRIKKPAECK